MALHEKYKKKNIPVIGNLNFECQDEIEYEYGFSILVYRLDIFTSHSHPMSCLPYLKPT